MKLDKLQVFQGNPCIVRGHDSIGSAGKGVGCDFVYPAISAGAKHHGFGLHHFHFSGLDIAHHHTVTTVAIDNQGVHVPLVINFYGFRILHELFMKGMQNSMTGAVGRKTSTRFRVPTKTALGNFSIWSAAENTTHML